MLRIKTMKQNALTIKPFQFADGVYYRLGKKLSKPEFGTVMVSCKTILEKFRARNWEDYEVWAFVDTLIYQMRKNQFPMVFRMFYAITMGFLGSNTYDVHETATSTQYSTWIQQEIDRLKHT